MGITQETIRNRTIFCRDNIEIMKGMDSDSIDLIYLDPPFNKKKLFTAPIGTSAEGASFSDYFSESDVKDEWVQTIREDEVELFNFLNGIKFVGNNYNYCYLCYMAIRLIECHRILKDTGSLYLHCDLTMSHYIKLMLDFIFGEKKFLNEIIWHYTGGGRSKNYFSRKHDSIFWYKKGVKHTFNIDSVRVPYDENSGYAKSGITAKSGKKYMPHPNGTPRDNVWAIPIINPMSKERKGYPTQKPLALLERIIEASSNEGDIVFDPFCGCATTCLAAERLGRQWIGIDISYKAFELIKERLSDEMESNKNLFNIDVNTDIHDRTDVPKRTDSGGIGTALIKKYVYIISNSKFKGEYKVGIASNVKNRLNSYQTSDPDRSYKLEYKLLTHEFRHIESAVHEHFKARHEWVKADLSDIIKEIERISNNLKLFL